MDTSALGLAASKLMDSIAEDWPDAELLDVLVIAEVDLNPDVPEEDDEEKRTSIEWRGTSHRVAVNLGLVDCVHAALTEPEDADA